MASQPAIVLPPAKMLHIVFDCRVIDNLAHNSSAFDHRLADVSVGPSLVQQYACKLEARADFGFPIVKLHDIALADAILPRSILEHCIHR